MERCYDHVLNEAEVKMSELSKENCESVEMFQKAIHILHNSFWKLKELVKQNGFDSIEEEIEFFKYVKPSICGKLIFYCRLLKLELKQPEGSSELLKVYYQKYLNVLNDYFEKNGDFVEYMRSKATYLDKYYFLRGKMNYRIIPEHFLFDRDLEFSTSHDFKAAELVAYEYLCVFINNRIENVGIISLDLFHQNNKLKWNKPKTALVELVYALHISGCFEGDINIKDIAKFFEQAFKIDLGDYYRIFIEIAKRKNHRAKFLESILNNFEQKLLETDE